LSWALLLETIEHSPQGGPAACWRMRVPAPVTNHPCQPTLIMIHHRRGNVTPPLHHDPLASLLYFASGQRHRHDSGNGLVQLAGEGAAVVIVHGRFSTGKDPSSNSFSRALSSATDRW